MFCEHSASSKKKRGKEIIKPKFKEEQKMRKFKKLTSIIAAAAMALTIMAPMAFAAKLPDDVAGTKYEESVQLLQALKVMVGDKDTGDFRLEDGIIRSEVAKIAVTLAGLSDVAEATKEGTRFPDVVANHWANGYINVAESQKFVIGDDYGNFRPDDQITFAEAVTILTRVLGYEPSALSNGGFPTGYLVAAGQMGLLKGGISTGADVKATRGTVAMLGYNSLTINLMERTGYGTDEKYEVVEKTLLKEKQEVSKLYGQVVANNESTLTGSSSLRDDEVQIKVDNQVETYKVNGTDAKGLLARNVVFYVHEEDTTTDKNLILVANDANKNTDITIKSTDLQDITGAEGSAKELSYWVNKEVDKKPETVTISSTAKVFYNGVATTYDLDELMALTSGQVTLLDTTRTDQFNYVFVTEYQNMIVDDVSLTSYRVSDKNNLLSLTLDPKDKNIKFSITKGGEAITLDKLQEWDVLSVAMDKKTFAESKVVNVYVSNEKVAGKVIELSEDKVKIGDKYYEIAANYTAANQPVIALNDEGIFYLDIEGKIAAVDTKTQVAGNYAYLVAADTTGALTDKLEFKLFNKNGETSIVTGADKIKVNNQSGLTAAAAKAALLAANGNSMPQLITYELNSKNEIYYVNTATLNGAAGTALKNVFSLDFKSDLNGIEYKATAKKLGNFNVNANTIVLDIPTGKTDSEDFAVRTIDMFVDKTKYEVEVYDLSEDLTAQVVIVKNSKGEINSEAPIALVDKITDTQNEDQVSVNKLYAIQDGAMIEKIAKDDMTLVKNGGEKLEPGDIIQYQTNARGEIDKVTVLFNSDERADASKETYTQYAGTEMETILGRVTKKFASSINVTSANMEETNLDISNAKVYNYDFSKSYGSQVSSVDASYIQKYDSADARKVFIRMYKGAVTEIVIIKEK